jgi:hypothetical protein
MIALRLVRLIEHHSDELVAELVIKLETSSRIADLHKVPIDELRRRLQKILRRSRAISYSVAGLLQICN